MSTKIISPKRKYKLLTLPDLTDPQYGVHAINICLYRLINNLSKNDNYPVPKIFRAARTVTTSDNFDSLLFSPDAMVRSPSHTLYISDDVVLRSHTSAMIPLAVRKTREDFADDIILCCPGICFRNIRDGRLYSKTPHQVDIWRFARSGPEIDSKSLYGFVECMMNSIFVNSNIQFRFVEIQKKTNISHPYLAKVFKIRVPFQGEMVSVGEAGVVNQALLKSLGLNSANYSALAVGIMLDRMVMIRKGLPDIRLLRSNKPEIKKQMRNLEPYRSISKFPPVTRDLSIVAHKEERIGDICETIRDNLGENKNLLEWIKIVSETPYSELPKHVIKRLNMSPEDKNILFRLSFRSHKQTLLKSEINKIMEPIISYFN